MRTKSEVSTWIAELLVSQFEVPAEKVSAEAHLFDDLDLDSIDAIDFMVTLEDLSGLRVEEDELRRLLRFQDIVELVHGKLAPR